MGEITRQAGGSRFRRGVRDYPAIGDEALRHRPGGFEACLFVDRRPLDSIGHLQQDSTIAALVDVDGLLTKHFAMLGSTGVGKSSGVAVILSELLRARPDVRVLLLDVHNEYSRSFGDKAPRHRLAQSEAALLALQFRGDDRCHLLRPARRRGRGRDPRRTDPDRQGRPISTKELGADRSPLAKQRCRGISASPPTRLRPT